MSSENASTSPSAVRDRDNHLKGSDHSPGSADVQSGELISLLDTIRSSRGQAAALRIRGEQMLVERQQREPLTRRLFESAGIESDSVKLESVAATPPTSIERPVRDSAQASAIGRFTIGVHAVDRMDLRVMPYDFDGVDGPHVEHNAPDGVLATSNKNSGDLRFNVTISENQSAVTMAAWVGVSFVPEINNGSLFFDTRVDYAKTDLVQTAGGATANTEGSIGLEVYQLRRGSGEDWKLIRRNSKVIWHRHWSSFWAESRGKGHRELHDTGTADHLPIYVQHTPGMIYAAVAYATCEADASGREALYASTAQADLLAQVISIAVGQIGETAGYSLAIPLTTTAKAETRSIHNP